MRKLELVGLDADGRHVVFVDDTGAEYLASADERLRAALRGDRARLGQLEIEMDSALRPRDIQARIRAGDTPESVAQLAQVSIDKVMPYCVPVLAERRHIAELARRHHVRRRNAEGPARTLDAVVSERLQSRGIEPGSADWDAWRRDDGRWLVRTTYLSGDSEHAAAFVFDAVGRYSLADDDEAKWLTGERQATRKGPQPREGGREGERRLSAVRTGDDLLSLPGDDDYDEEEATDDLTAVIRAVAEPERESGGGDGSGPDSVIGVATIEPEPDQDDDDDSQSDPVPGTPDEPVVEVAPERRRRSARRASVPSWDEIMFGKSKDSEP
jgi:Protein of unknown function (DUF3071)